MESGFSTIDDRFDNDHFTLPDFTLLDSTLHLLHLSLLYFTSLDLTLLYKQLTIVVVILNDILLPTPTYSYPLLPTSYLLLLLPTPTYTLLLPTLRTVDGNSAWPTHRGNPWQTRGGRRPLAPAASCPAQAHGTPLWGARYSREEALGGRPPHGPPNLRGSFWLVLLVNLLQVLE